MSQTPVQPVIGIIGDRNPGNPTHLATERAFRELPEPLAFEWVPTETIPADPAALLAPYSGLLISPGSPYRSMEGALAAIRHARQTGLPILGTCGGFQHMVVEFARNVLGIEDADHAETNPDAARLAVTPLSCSLVGQSHPVRILPGTLAIAIYGTERSVEPFFCNYGLNPEFLPRLEAAGLKASGLGEDGTVRILELDGHPFFFANLFVPQARVGAGPHPVLLALAAAARATAAARA